MATYNWAYRPGIANKYGFVIAASADDVKPSNACYVALFGNDATGNGSRIKPYKTLKRVFDLNLQGYSFVILGSGVYREIATGYNIGNQTTIVGDGDVTIDASYFTGGLWANNYCCGFCNITLKGNGIMALGVNQVNGNLLDCVLDGIGLPSNMSTTITKMVNVVIKNFFSLMKFTAVLTLDNVMFHRCSNITYEPTNSPSVVTRSTIFSECNIYFKNANLLQNISYSLFHRCNFKVGTSTYETINKIYPLTPLGYSYIETLQELIDFYKDYFGVSYNIFQGCTIADPKFNNPEIGDFSLAFDSPAKNLSYFGTYVGAQSIGYPIKASTTEASGDFDFSTAVNMSINDNSVKFIDTSLVASVETVVKPNLIARELGKAPIYGFNADRNGQYIDSIKDLALTTIPAGTLLTLNTPYIVEGAGIVYNGSAILAGERFTTGSELSFTSAGGGVCREITEAPQRHTILARFSDGGATITAGTNLTAGWWYYAVGTINYNGVDYTEKVFKAVDTNPFLGSGVARVAMGDEVYQHYETGVKFKSNNFGDTRTGAIIKGNGDPDYQRGSTKEFPINARFIQIKYVLQPNNLRP